MSAIAHRVGRRAAWASCALALAYVIAQLAEYAGWLGSTGGPHATSTPLGLALLLTPSLLLGPAWVLTAASAVDLADGERRVWGRAALGFAVMYATLIGLVYFVQLTFVLPRLAAGRMADIELLRFVPFDSFLYSVDLLGYSTQSVSTLCLACALAPVARTRAARRWLVANGLLVPFLVGQLFWPALIYGGMLWAITFPAAMIALARLFDAAPPAAT